MNTEPKRGRVILAGAGPGDPDLITVKAIRSLQEADVVIVDRLVSQDIIKRYVKKDALVIYAGKQAGKKYSTRQNTISQLLVDYALDGNYVVRLKGGDVSVFSNILDELEYLAGHNIPYEIIPGITAALGAAASAAIPLTARNYSTAVRFLTCYDLENTSDTYWEELSSTSDTLVFYMSASTLPIILSNLKEKGIDANKEIALVEQASTPLQKVRIFRFDAEELDQQVRFISPALVIIGKVVGLHEKFRWKENYEGDEFYFHPLTKALNAQTPVDQVHS